MPRWQHRKSLSPPPSTCTPNRHLHTQQFILRRNGSLSEPSVQGGIKKTAREMVMEGSPPQPCSREAYHWDTWAQTHLPSGTGKKLPVGGFKPHCNYNWRELVFKTSTFQIAGELLELSLGPEVFVSAIDCITPWTLLVWTTGWTHQLQTWRNGLPASAHTQTHLSDPAKSTVSGDIPKQAYTFKTRKGSLFA